MHISATLILSLALTIAAHADNSENMSQWKILNTSMNDLVNQGAKLVSLDHAPDSKATTITDYYLQNGQHLFRCEEVIFNDSKSRKVYGSFMCYQLVGPRDARAEK